MKIINPAAFAFAFACIMIIIAAVSAKKGFTPPPKPGSVAGPKTAANFDAQGVKMEICPTGDCLKGKYMRLSVTSLTELNPNGGAVVSVNKFKPKNSDWTDIETSEVAGVNVSSTVFVSTIEVGTANTKAQFNLTASIYQGNATVAYGSQTIAVPAGALKFTVDIAGWPFAATANNLALAVSLDAKGPNSKALGRPQKKPKGKNAAVSDIERVDMGDSMFMDVPSLVILNDGVEASLVNMSVVESAGNTSLRWVFPSFTMSLHYDPVLGDAGTFTTSSSTSTTSTTSSTTTSTLTPTATTATTDTSGSASGSRNTATPTSSDSSQSPSNSSSDVSSSSSSNITDVTISSQSTSPACTTPFTALAIGVLMAATTFSVL